MKVLSKMLYSVSAYEFKGQRLQDWLFLMTSFSVKLKLKKKRYKDKRKGIMVASERKCNILLYLMPSLESVVDLDKILGVPHQTENFQVCLQCFQECSSKRLFQTKI